MRGAEAVEPVVARLEMMLEFQFRVVRGNVSALAVIFEPAGFHRLFGVPAAPLSERGTEGRAVLGTDVSQLYERLGNATSFFRRVNMLNAFFLKQLEESPNWPLSIHGFRSLLKSGRHGGVAQVGRQLGMSTRQLERKSLEYFGLSLSYHA